MVAGRLVLVREFNLQYKNLELSAFWQTDI